jgi:hypothetical protein
MFNLRVLCSWPSEKDGIPWWYEYSINPIKVLSHDVTDKKFKWTLAYEASFQELKKRLTTSPVLVMLDMEKPFSIYCDALRQGLGCVLMQDGHGVAYAS